MNEMNEWMDHMKNQKCSYCVTNESSKNGIMINNDSSSSTKTLENWYRIPITYHSHKLR
jgi:hypothetical protein